MGWFEILRDIYAGTALTKAQQERLALKAEQIEQMEVKLRQAEKELADWREKATKLERELNSVSKSRRTLLELKNGPVLDEGSHAVLLAISQAVSISPADLNQKLDLSPQLLMYHVEELCRHQFITSDSEDDWIDEFDDEGDEDQAEPQIFHWELTAAGRKYLYGKGMLS